jgi:CDP-6-deoxy-D-xylo-4-hexulose-3-dehydrase
VFLTHAQGFNGLSKNILSVLRKRKIILIEDVCESHGATFNKKKLGSFGLISNFSFYYAHHMSTIEGGMVCTNDKKIYETVRMLRAHGMVRESGNINFERKMIKKYKHLSPKFIFLFPGFNMRNNEISGTIGINQLKRLDTNNIKRIENFSYFLKNIDGNIYYNNFDIAGNSNYAFPLILRDASIKLRDNLERLMSDLDQNADVMTALALFPVKRIDQKITFVLGLALLFKVPFDILQLVAVRSTDPSDWLTIVTQTGLCLAFMNNYGLLSAIFRRK